MDRLASKQEEMEVQEGLVVPAVTEVATARGV
jgi:hypothetical protein